MAVQAARVVPWGSGDAFAADQVQRTDVVVHPGDAVVENHGVGDDGTGHAAGLGHVVHAQQPGDGRIDSGVQAVHLLQDVGGIVNALLEIGSGLVNGVLGYGDEADKVGQVGHRAVEPAGLREADGPASLGGEDAVAQRRLADGGGKVVGIADGLGIAQGNGGLDGARLAGDVQPEASGGLGLDVLGRVVLGLDDDGGAPGIGDEDVGLEPGAPLDDLGVLGAHGGLAQHSLEDAAEGVVGAGFGLVRHGSLRSGLSSILAQRLRWRNRNVSREARTELSEVRPHPNPLPQGRGRTTALIAPMKDSARYAII